MSQHPNRNDVKEFARPLPIEPSEQILNSAPQSLPLDDTNNKDGIIIIQNNQFFITSPLSGGKPAVISPVPPVVLRKNRQIITAPTEVLSSDRLEWEIEEPAPYEITVSEDKLSAFLTLRRLEQYAWRLKDCAATNNIAVSAEQDKKALLSTVRIEQVLADFDKKSISQNLNIPAIYEALNHPTGRPVRVAEGTAPKPAINARIEIPFSEEALTAEIFHRNVSGQEEQNYPDIPEVQEGDIVAIKHPPIEGVPGYDVYGHLLPAAPPEDFQLIAKEHTQLISGLKVMALRTGRPRLTGVKGRTFDIAAAHRVLGNVNPETGHIVFPGDVAVHGDVEEQMIIEAIGNVYIYGNVKNATIVATGSIWIHGDVVESRLYSGYHGVLNNRLYHLSKQILEEGNLLRKAAKVLAKKLENRQQPVNYGQVIQLLLDTKYKRFAILIPELLHVLSDIKHSYPQDIKQLKRLLEVFLQPDQFIGMLNDAVVESFLKLLKDMYNGITVMLESKVRIDLPYSDNSIIQSGGNITIYGKGTRQSNLQSDGDIAYTSRNAVCEDSNLEATGAITAQTVGGTSETNSVLKAGKRLVLHKMSGGRISVGGYSEEVTGLLENAVITPQTLQRRQ
ncbi:flagellar assembly protein A [Paenibacillus sp. GCM10012306]|uniref:flagellar assembly protein A n=1 Tax=Paenibacillus sp. GCM10012306 TaxID=3317342 RepID=UPI00360C238F